MYKQRLLFYLCLLFAFSLNLMMEIEPIPPCKQPLDYGPCTLEYPRFFFDAITGRCVPFAFGGCGGNENNFPTEMECLRTCSKSNDISSNIPECNLKADPGICDASIPRFYHDVKSKSCKSFLYGGCEGNGNNFFDIEKCERVCQVDTRPKEMFICDLKPDQGPCTGYTLRFYHDRKSKSCRQFVYGGCSGNENNFGSADECTQHCGEKLVLNPICEQKPSSGSCVGYFPRYYFDVAENGCKVFIYKGCEGNGNNFETKEKCEKICSGQNGLNFCNFAPDPGPCTTHTSRFHFDPAIQTCTKFIYGGCGGNRNNFPTKEDCEQYCIEYM